MSTVDFQIKLQNLSRKFYSKEDLIVLDEKPSESLWETEEALVLRFLLNITLQSKQGYVVQIQNFC